MSNDAVVSETKTLINILDDSNPPESTTPVATTSTDANCDTLGPYLSNAMTNPKTVPGCQDELGRLNLFCATIKICPERALTGDYLDLSNLVFTIPTNGNTKYSLPVYINGDVPVILSNTTWQVSSGGQSVTIIVDNPSLVNSEWHGATLRSGMAFIGGDLRGAQFTNPTVIPDTEAALTFYGTLVDGVQVAGPGLTPGLVPQLPTGIVFANTTGTVTFSGQFEQVYVMLAGTTGNVQVSGATMGQWYNGRSIYISNIFNPDNGQCTQSHVPSLTVKASTMSGLDTWPTDTYSTCSVPPAIGSVQLLNSQVACLHVASSTPGMTIVVDGSELSCTDPTLSTPFCPRGWFAMPPQTKAVISSSHMQDCHWAPSYGSAIYSLQVTHSNITQTGSGQAVFSNIAGAPVELTNVTAYTTYGVNEASPLVLLDGITVPKLTLGSMQLNNVNFYNVNVTGVTDITGPVIGSDVAFDDVSFVCENGGVLPSRFNITNPHIYCSSNAAPNTAATAEPVTTETNATYSESAEPSPVAAASSSTWLTQYAEPAITPALLGGIGGVTSALNDVAQERGVGTAERLGTLGVATFVCYVLVSMRTSEDTAAALQQATVLMLMTMLFQAMSWLANLAAKSLAQEGYTTSAQACAFAGRHVSKGVTLYGASSPTQALAHLAVGAVVSTATNVLAKGISQLVLPELPKSTGSDNTQVKNITP